MARYEVMDDPKRPNKALIAALLASVMSGLGVIVKEYADVVPLFVLVICAVVISAIGTFLATFYVKNPKV